MSVDSDAGGTSTRASQASRRLPRTARLLSRKDFSRIQSQGVRARGRTILVIGALPANPPGAARARPAGARLGLSVGRRFDATAVARNRARRLLREAFRLERPALPALELVVIPVCRPGELRLRELRDELVTLARRAARKLGVPCGD